MPVQTPDREGSAITYDVHVERGLQVSMRDGVTLAADVYRPSVPAGDPRTFPTILERTPYDRSRPFMSRCGRYFASRGYTWVVVDCRGRFDSEGEFRFFFDDLQEGMDGYDSVEWIAAQPWSDGRVGTTGLSFAGANQQALAVERPPHLVTQVMIDCGFNYWRRGLRNNGAFSSGFWTPYVLTMAIDGAEARADAGVRRSIQDFRSNMANWSAEPVLSLGSTPLALAPSYERWYRDLVTTGDYEGVFRSSMCSLEDRIDDYPDIPVCFLTGWYGMRHAWANLRKHQILSDQNDSHVKTVIGHWLHLDDFMEQTYAGDVDFGNDSVRDLNDFRLRWFDQFLKGYRTGILDEPRLEVWTMGGGSGRRNSAGRLDHGGKWASLSRWPADGAEERKLYLARDMRLSPEPPAGGSAHLEYVFDPAAPVPTVGGGIQHPEYCPGGGFDQRGHEFLVYGADEPRLSGRPDVLTFRSEPLPAPVEVTGDVFVELWVTSTTVDTDFTAKLVDEYPPSEDYPDGYDLNLVDDVIRMSYRDGRLRRELIEPGQIYPITLGPMPISNLFAAGHRIRIDISSSSFPAYDVNPNTGAPFGDAHGAVVTRNSVLIGAGHPSCLTIPVTS